MSYFAHGFTYQAINTSSNELHFAAIISDLNRMPMEALRFRDFAKLKSGYVAYSRLKPDKVREEVGPEVRAEVEREFPNDQKSQTSVIRWYLRGLDFEKALRKVKTDLEIAENARMRKVVKA
jgi:hypothetical protein